MSRTRDELCQGSYDRRRTSHAVPARNDPPRVGPLCAPVVAAGLAPGLEPACGGAAGPRAAYRHRRPAGGRGGGRAPRYERPSGLEASDVVRGPGQSDAVRPLADRPGTSGGPIGLGADDTVERRSGRRITAKGGDREAVRSTKTPVIRCCGLQGVSMRRLVPGPGSRRVWALPCLTAWCWPADKRDRRRHKTRGDWVRQLMPQVHRGRPGRRLVLVVEGGLAAVSRALACVKPHVVMGSRVRWDAALSHPPAPQPQGTRGPKPLQGTRQRRGCRGWSGAGRAR